VSSIVQRPPAGTGWAGVLRRLSDWGPAAAVFVLGIVAWEGLTRGLGVEEFLLPPLSGILDTLREQWSTIWSAGLFTFKEALGGFVIGSSAGILVALVLARWRGVGRAFMPYAIAANAIPIIAFAPITNNWFGILSPASKMAIAGVLVFFPVLVNTLRGLTSVRPGQIELMRSYAAGEMQIFRRVRLPAALPYMFSGLKVGTVLAMIGAIVGDYFGGSQDALGILIRRSAGIFDFKLAWAAIVVASIFGMLFYAAVATVERLTMRGYPTARGADV
jgi:NitT/TauT family transport system permease protein